MNEFATQLNAIKYARGPATEPLGEQGEGLLAAIREDPYTPLRHGILADYLDEQHGNHPLHDFIRSHFERGTSNDNLWHDEFDNSYDGSHPDFIPVGHHSGFRFWLGTEGPLTGEPGGPHQLGGNARYIVKAQPHRVRNRKLHDLAYAMEFPDATSLKAFADAGKLPAIHSFADMDPQDFAALATGHEYGRPGG